MMSALHKKMVSRIFFDLSLHITHAVSTHHKSLEYSQHVFAEAHNMFLQRIEVLLMNTQQVF